CLTYQLIINSAPILTISTPNSVPLNSLWLFIILGFVLGIIGSCSNFLILKTRSFLAFFYNKNKFNFIITGAVLPGTFGLLFSFRSELAGDGFNVIPKVVEGLYGFYPLFLILIFRFFATIISFGSGA